MRRYQLPILILLLVLPLFVFPQQLSKLNRSLQNRVAKAARSGEVIPLLIKGDTEQVKQLVLESGGTYKRTAGNIARVDLPLNKVLKLTNYKSVYYMHDMRGKIRPMNDQMVINNNVKPVHVGALPLPKAYTGKGVLLGIIDSGIEINHPDFNDKNGTTRIEYIWDQAVPANNPPPGYNYGQEWDAVSIITNNCSHVDHAFGHGTNVAGIAGGSGMAVNNYAGAAPESKYLIVSLDFASGFMTNFLDAVTYIYDKAEQLGKPCVINASVGAMGLSWDGLDPVAEFVDNLIKEQDGRVLVNAAGNSGDRDFHLSYEVSSDTSFTWFEYRLDNASEDSLDGVYFFVFGDTAEFNTINFGFAADNPANWSRRGQTPMDQIKNRLGQLVCEDIMNGPNLIGTICTYADLISYDSSSYYMEVFIATDSTDYFWRFMTEGSGTFDLWSGKHPEYETNTAEMVKTAKLPGTAELPEIVNYKLPDTRKTLVSSWNCLPSVISVGNYNNREWWTNVFGFQMQVTEIPAGEIGVTSSQGPTRLGVRKPEVAASGNFTLAPAMQVDWNTFNTALGGMHVTNGGTSSAAPVVAGVAALYMEKVFDDRGEWPGYQEVRDVIVLGAKADSYTGNVFPDDTWGWGKVDAFQALNTTVIYGCMDPTAFNYKPDANMEDGTCVPFVYGCMDQSAENYDSSANVDDGSCLYTGIAEALPVAAVINCYPNPAKEQTWFHYKINGDYKNVEITITDVLGKNMATIPLDRKQGELSYSTIQLGKGVYFYQLELDGQRQGAKRMVRY